MKREQNVIKKNGTAKQSASNMLHGVLAGLTEANVTKNPGKYCRTSQPFDKKTMNCVK